jgi:signal transduction histidine kinase
MTLTGQLRFEIHPSVVYKLGEDLITDEVQALAELVKNCYDADSDYAIVRINTELSPPSNPMAVGFIEIEDNGLGMSPVDVQRGWLTISNSQKREMKARGETTDDKKRTPLGDKGLGRLGAQRLGDQVFISTTPKDSPVDYEISFNWRSFGDYETLSEVPVKVSQVPATRRRGTKIVISDLHEVDRLISENGRQLQVELSKVVSPYTGVDKFQLLASLNDVALDLAEFDKRVRSAAQVRYKLQFDGERLIVGGDLKLSLVRPAKDALPDYEEFIESDDGSALLEFIRNSPRAATYKVRRSPAQGWWATFNYEESLSSIKGVHLEDDGTIASPGYFSAEVDGFNLQPDSIKRAAVFDTTAEFKNYISDLHGIRVYRDGFNIRVDEDWLGLGKKWSTGGSWYGLRPATTMGYVALTADGNQQLVETTDREGFKRTPHFENFGLLMQNFLKFTSDLQEVVGRGASNFRKSVALPHDGTSPEALASRLSSTLSSAVGFREPLSVLRASLQATADESETIADRLGTAELSDDDREAVSSLMSLSSHALTAAALIADLDRFIEDLVEQKQTGERLQSEMESLEEQLSLAYETVAVGLTAEALSHEIANISERLARRTTEVARYVSRLDPPDRQIANFIDLVRTSVAGLRRQLAHLAPSLRYVRERRELLRIEDVVQETSDYFAARWQKQPLVLEVNMIHGFLVLMNRGKLLQVLDNLILNSEYWLREDLRISKIESGVVTMDIDSPSVMIRDNGRGIDRSVERTLFEPFVSKKPSGEGRGLGLFIVRQLLAAEGCDVKLATNRNEQGNKFIFEVDLIGAVQGDEFDR